MKIFRYKKGHISGQTLTVGELVQELAKYPAAMPVLCEWEGQRACIDHDSFREQYTDKGNEADGEICLIINADC